MAVGPKASSGAQLRACDFLTPVAEIEAVVEKAGEPAKFLF
jgi:hypothetical protein